MKKSTKKKITRKLNKFIKSPKIKKTGLLITGSLAVIYLVYQVYQVGGFFKSL